MKPRGMLLAAVLSLLWLGQALHAHGQPAEVSREAPAGGLLFVNHPAIVVDALELILTPAEVKANYSIRNIADKPVAILVAFQLPDIDAAASADQPVAIPAPQSSNFVAASFLVEESPIAVEVEQRAYALGLDVSRTLESARIPLFPYSKGNDDRLTRLAPVLKSELEQRGIARSEGLKFEPNWVLKSTAHWRQAFQPRQTVRMSFSYRPIIGQQKFSPQLLESLRGPHCIDQAVESEINRRAAAKAGQVTLRWLGFLLTSGSGLLTHPIGNFRLQIARPSIDSLVVTCRKGLRLLGPTTQELAIGDFNPDEDLSILFVE